MRILVASTRGAGHFNPLVPLIEAARRADHEVLVAGPPEVGERIGTRGWEYWPLDPPPEEVLGPVWGSVQESTTAEEAEQIVVGQIFGTLNVEAALPGLLDACNDWRPGLVVREPSEYASAVAAHSLGIPQTRSAIGLHSTEVEMNAIALPGVEPRSPGVSDAIADSPYLTSFPESFESPDVPAPTRTHRFRDPSLAETPEPLGDWWPGDERPLVYLSFGSVAGTLPTAVPLYRTAVAAMADVPARVLVTVGNEFDPRELGDPPDNVHVERWVPQANVLAVAEMVVCHGGSGTTLGALGAGLPLVIVPLFADQGPNAQRAAELGAGVAVEPLREAPAKALPTSIDSGALGEAVARVLDGDECRARAEELAAEMRGYPPADEALAAVLPGS